MFREVNVEVVGNCVHSHEEKETRIVSQESALLLCKSSIPFSSIAAGA